MTCEWARAGTSTFQETSGPVHLDGVWEIGPVRLDPDVDFRISVNDIPLASGYIIISQGPV